MVKKTLFINYSCDLSYYLFTRHRKKQTSSFYLFFYFSLEFGCHLGAQRNQEIYIDSKFKVIFSKFSVDDVFSVFEINLLEL